MRSASPGPNKGRANPARPRSSLLPPSASVERQLGKHSWDRQKHVRSLGCLQISCCFAWCFVKWGAHFLLDKEMRLFVWRVSRTNCPTLTTPLCKHAAPCLATLSVGELTSVSPSRYLGPAERHVQELSSDRVLQGLQPEVAALKSSAWFDWELSSHSWAAFKCPERVEARCAALRLPWAASLRRAK
ncbi:unnamed protein product [Effrenium voratum]|nr:unnamed protein product [Effrenium voratum]